MTADNKIDFDDFPTVGVSAFDVWFTSCTFILITEYNFDFKWIHDNLDPEDWREYFDADYTPKEAVDEDMSYWRN